MRKSAQKNRYELTMRDGSKQTIIANSYNEAINACHIFCMPATQIQRINRNGERRSVKNV
jgi:hypothetical protein